MKIKKMLLAGVVAATSLAGTGTSSAAPCTPIGTFVGGVTVTVCLGVDTPPAGYPSTGVYVATNGYLQVCRPGGCATVPLNVGATGAAIVPGQVVLHPTPGGGYNVELFPGAVIVKVAGIDFRYGPNPICVGAHGTC